MIPQLGDEQGIVGNLVDDAMFSVDSAGPINGQTVFERLGLADPLLKPLTDAPCYVLRCLISS
jgi:hypothetical protein